MTTETDEGERRPLTFREICEFYRIRRKVPGTVAFSPSTWFDEQQRFDRERTGRDIVIKGRQIGFSTLELLRGLWQAQTREGWITEVVIHDSKKANALFDAVHLAYRSTGGHVPDSRPRRSQVRELALGNDSIIRIEESGATKRTAEGKGRSGTIHRLHATEVAFWHEADTSMAGLLAAVPGSGEILIESTPNGAAGWFYDKVLLASQGRGEFKLHFFPWWQHAEYQRAISLDFERTPLSDWEKLLLELGCTWEQIAFWRAQVDSTDEETALQEYPINLETCFRAGGGRYIDPKYCDAIRCSEPIAVLTVFDASSDAERKPVLGDLRVWQSPAPGKQYVVGADVAEGIEKDASSATVLDRRTGAVCATFWSDTIDPGDFGVALAEIGRLYNTALVAPERNNHGHATLGALKTRGRYHHIYELRPGRPGWETNPVTRPVLFDDFKAGIKDGSITTPDSAALAEWRTLVRKDGKPMHQQGAHDDRVVSHAIAHQLRFRGEARTDFGETIGPSDADQLGDFL